MPTGYTSNLYDGDQSFEDFVLGCARAFGALVTLRDEPTAPIPDEFQPSPSYTDALAKAQERVEWLENAHDQALWREQTDRVKTAIQRREEYIAEREALRYRYKKMLDRVEGWSPPTEEHIGLRKFMIEQLVQSIQHDCGSYTPSVPSLRTTATYRRDELDKARADAIHYREELSKDRQRASERTAWVRSLRESL